MPNDADEQTRQQILHEVFQHAMGDRLTTVPLHHPRKILDIGTGTGEWAMAMGDEYPDAEIIGTDIAKIQPTAVPLNVFFEIDDAEEDGGWTWPEDEFDLVHLRFMLGAFKDWNAIYREAYRHLKPGGWIEIVDFDDQEAFLDYFRPDSKLRYWIHAVRTATQMAGRPRSVEHLEIESLAAVGFVDISRNEQVIPMGVWPDDREEQKVGTHFLVAMLNGFKATCLRPLVEQLGWEYEKVNTYERFVVDEIKTLAKDAERARGLGFRFKILVGRKPEEPVDAADRGSAEGSAETESVRTMTMTNGDVVRGS